MADTCVPGRHSGMLTPQNPQYLYTCLTALETFISPSVMRNAFSVCSRCSTCLVGQGSSHHAEVSGPRLQVPQQVCTYTHTCPPPCLGERKVGFEGASIERGLRQSPGVLPRFSTRWDEQPWCPSLKTDWRQVAENRKSRGTNPLGGRGGSLTGCLDVRGLGTVPSVD